MKSTHITQKEIADRLGVSRQLVTHALNGIGTISEQKRREVIEAAEEMGYRRNEIARAMVTGKSSTLGFLSYETDQSDHLMRVLSGAIDAANDHGYFIRAMHYSETFDVRRVLERCIEWRVAGLLVMNVVDEAMDYLQDEAHRLGIPLAFVENQPSELSDIWVRSDDLDGLRQVIEHLVELGHRRIAFFNGNAEARLSIRRDNYFRELIERAGLPFHPELSVHGSWDMENPLIDRAAQQLLAANPRPTAVVCAGDPFAMAMIRAAQNAGLQLPEQLSVTGFANFYLSNLTNPALTTVDQSFRAMGRTATEKLITLSNSPGALHPKDYLSPTRLVVRASTAPPAQTALPAH